MKRFMNKMNEKKGFTLAELLIVVAIIAVLVAVAIPVFTAQLEKAREATDLANLRAAYAEQMTELLTWDGSTAITDITVDATQTQGSWQGGADKVGDITVTASTTGWTVKADTANNAVTITVQ